MSSSEVGKKPETSRKPESSKAGKRDHDQRSPDSDDHCGTSKKLNLSMELSDDVLTVRIADAIGNYMKSSAFQELFGSLFKQLSRDMIKELTQPVLTELATLRNENESLKTELANMKERAVKHERLVDELDQNRRSKNMIIINDWSENRYESPFRLE